MIPGIGETKNFLEFRQTQKLIDEIIANAGSARMVVEDNDKPNDFTESLSVIFDKYILWNHNRSGSIMRNNNNKWDMVIIIEIIII